MSLGAKEAIIVTRSEPFSHWREGHVMIRDIEVVETGDAVKHILRHLSSPIDPPFRRHTECLVLHTDIPPAANTRLHIRQTTEPGHSSTFHIVEVLETEGEKEEAHA